MSFIEKGATNEQTLIQHTTVEVELRPKARLRVLSRPEAVLVWVGGVTASVCTSDQRSKEGLGYILHQHSQLTVVTKQQQQH